MLLNNLKRRAHDHRMTQSSYVALGKFFALLSAGTFTFLAVIGFVVWLQAKVLPSPDSSMRGIAAAVPDRVFVDLLSMEVAGIDQPDRSERLAAASAPQVFFELVTGINPQDPRSVLASEIVGLEGERTVLFRKGVATDVSVYPIDHTPSPDVLQPIRSDDRSSTDDTVEEDGSGNGKSHDEPIGAESDQEENIPTTTPDARQRVKVFIYHSHNRESWVPELEGVSDPSDAYDTEVNITLLGKRLAERLEEEGVGAKVSDKDYPSAIKEFNYNLSYSYSLKTVQEAAATYPDLQYYFDIHRDSQRRDLTTAKIDGVEYAQVYFVIGHKNPNWQQNEAFAQKIHDVLEERYPGLSRGIYGKTAKTGNGEYNQHISPNAILIEVGGPENTLDESYRTIDVLAEVISELTWDADKVDAPVPSGEVVSASVNVPDDGE